MKLVTVLHDPYRAKISSGRVFMLAVGCVVLAAWLAVGLSIEFRGKEWATYSGWLAWGRDLAFGSIAAVVLKHGADVFSPKHEKGDE